MTSSPYGVWTDELLDGVRKLADQHSWQLTVGSDRGPAGVLDTTDGRSLALTRLAIGDAETPATTHPSTVAVEVLHHSELTPTTVSARLTRAVTNGRGTLFVVEDESTATQLQTLLGYPSLCAASRNGLRTFYNGPDRIPLAEGGYGLVAGDRDAIRWRETLTPSGPVPGDPSGNRDTRLVCEVADEVVAVLGGVSALCTPPQHAFPYWYRRDPADKRFHVYADQNRVATFGTVAELRAAGYSPAPLPLVPTQLFGPTPSFWTVCYRDERGTPTVQAEPLGSQ